jgi:hypothetical protein
MINLYQFIGKLEILISTRQNLVTSWEHKFGSNLEMATTPLNEYNLVEPPKLRDAFSGGRTEPFRYKILRLKMREVDALVFAAYMQL